MMLSFVDVEGYSGTTSSTKKEMQCWWVGGGKLHVKVFMYIVSRGTSKLFNTS